MSVVGKAAVGMPVMCCLRLGWRVFFGCGVEGCCSNRLSWCYGRAGAFVVRLSVTGPVGSDEFVSLEVSTQCPGGTYSDDGWAALATSCRECSSGSSSLPGSVACDSSTLVVPKSNGGGGLGRSCVAGIVIGGVVLLVLLLVVVLAVRWHQSRKVHSRHGVAWPADVTPTCAHPVGAFPSEVRTEWDSAAVSAWLAAQNVSDDVVGKLRGQGVNGFRLYTLYFAAARNDRAQWASVGVSTDGDVKQVVAACEHLEENGWSKLAWVCAPQAAACLTACTWLHRRVQSIGDLSSLGAAPRAPQGAREA